MTTQNEKLMSYVAPQVEVVTIEIEKGFAISGGFDQQEVENDIYLDDVEDGGFAW